MIKLKIKRGQCTVSQTTLISGHDINLFLSQTTHKPLLLFSAPEKAALKIMLYIWYMAWWVLSETACTATAHSLHSFNLLFIRSFIHSFFRQICSISLQMDTQLSYIVSTLSSWDSPHFRYVHEVIWYISHRSKWIRRNSAALFCAVWANANTLESTYFIFSSMNIKE